jgi:hypothetical protein
MNATDYTAHIIANPGDDELTPVDLRTLSREKLTEMRQSWPLDPEMLATINELLDRLAETRWRQTPQPPAVPLPAPNSTPP